MMIVVLSMACASSVVVSMGAGGYLWYNNYLCDWLKGNPAWVCRNTSSTSSDTTNTDTTNTDTTNTDTSGSDPKGDCRAKAKAYCDSFGKKGKAKDTCMKYYMGTGSKNGDCCNKPTSKGCQPKSST